MDQIDRLIIAMEGEENVRRMTEALGLQEQATERARSKMAGFGQASLQTSRALQDLTQGGIAGVLNNIEGIAMALGGGPGLAGIMTAVGVAAYIAGPKLKEFWTSLSGGEDGDKIPKIREGFEGLRDTLKEVEEQIKSLKEHEEDLDFFAEKRLAELRQVREEITQRQADERIVAGAGAGTTRAVREQAAAVRKAVAELPEGAETIVGALTANGVAAADATRMAAGALRGNAQDLQDILDKIEPEGAMVGLFAATPERRRERAQEAAMLKADDARKKRVEARQRQAAAQLNRQTNEDMANWDAETQEKARQDRAATADNAAEAREMMAAAAPEEARRAVNLRAARRNVISEVQSRGLTPNAEQLDQMASAALSGMSNGLNAQQAAWLSVQRKLESIQRMAMEFQAAQSRMMMGGDQNGHFPQTPALWP